MDLADLRDHCLTKPHVTEDFPFGPDVLVFRVDEKIFLLTNVEDYPSSFNVKCDPQRALELREEHPAITPGYHMNKKHWNTVVLDGTLPEDLVVELVDHSFDLVVASLSRKRQTELGFR